MAEKDPTQHIIEMKNQMGQLQAYQEAERQRGEKLQAQQDKIQEAVSDIHQRLSAMPDQEHAEHHQFVKTMLREYEQKQEFRAVVLQKIAAGGGWALIAGLTSIAWYGFKHKFGIGE
ncbi:hypothetical protein [Marinobacterium stanieri]|uniref:hypothetical protein n=1 Tax=Marinobacterium stanieri TaxID=49186 RepID=UPI0002558F0D|nr:hypothetical protein [Marinobacterium stanieri]